MSRVCQIISMILEGLIGVGFLYSFTVTGRKFEVLLGAVWVLLCITHIVSAALDRKRHK